MLVSVCLIVCNEEHNLDRALRSIPKSFEVVVADTGSTDSTIAIAERSGARVVQIPWTDDFAAARNACAQHATGEYILAMDADEELPADTELIVLQYINECPGTAAAVIIENQIGEERPRHRMVRFYPRDGLQRFSGFVHEQVYLGQVPAPFGSMTLRIAHYGYESDEYESKQKSSRYIPMYERYLSQNPEDGYMLYQFGKLLYSLKKLDEAEIYLRASYEQGAFERLYYPVMAVMLGYVLKEQGKSVQAEALLEPLLPLYPEFPDLFFLMGLLAMDTGKLQAIESNFVRALAIGEIDKYTSVNGVGTYRAAYNLGIFYEITGSAEQAAECYRMAAQYGYQPAIARSK